MARLLVNTTMKLHIRYAKKAELPKGFEALYSPVKADDPEGQHIFSGFESDPDGFALANVSKLSADLAREKAEAHRRNEALQKFRKDKANDKSELWTPEEIEELVQARAKFEELQGKVPDVEQLRKQTAAEVAKQFEGKERAAAKQMEAAKREAAFYRERYKASMRKSVAAEAFAGLTPKKGLGDVALSQFASYIDFEELPAKDGEREFSDFVPRIKGKDGFRLNGKGEALAPSEFARGDFIRDLGELFEPMKNASGTGHSPNNNVPGGGGAGAGGGAHPGSGRFTMRMEEVSGNVGKYRETLRNIPGNDYLHVTDGEGKVIQAVPGQAPKATA